MPGGGVQSGKGLWVMEPSLLMCRGAEHGLPQGGAIYASMGGTCSFIFHYGEEDRAGGLFSHRQSASLSPSCPFPPPLVLPPPNPHPTRGTPGSPPARCKSSSRSPALQPQSPHPESGGGSNPPQVVRNGSPGVQLARKGAVWHSRLELVWSPLLCCPLNHLLLEASRSGRGGRAGFRASPLRGSALPA